MTIRPTRVPAHRNLRAQFRGCQRSCEIKDGHTRAERYGISLAEQAVVGLRWSKVLILHEKVKKLVFNFLIKLCGSHAHLTTPTNIFAEKFDWDEKILDPPLINCLPLFTAQGSNLETYTYFLNVRNICNNCPIKVHIRMNKTLLSKRLFHGHHHG